MKITLFIGSLYGGGAERVACNLANYLSNIGHTVNIITMAESKQSYGLSNKVCNIILLKNVERKNTIFNFIIRWNRLKTILKNNNTDCYVVLLPVTTIMLLLLKKKTNAPVIAAERVDPSQYSHLKKKALKILAKRADKFIFQTNEIRNWYGSSVKNESAVVIPNAINPAFIRPRYEGEREKIIVGVGRLTEQKNFSMLIDAFAELHKEFLDYKLIIYGEGPLKSALEHQVELLGISESVLLPGNEKDIISKLEIASMFVLSSRFEGMPNALMEAMALGVPCVSTDCGGGGARFLIRNGENGLLIPNEDKDAMVEAMKKILSDEKYSEELSKNAHKIIEFLAPDIIYKKWEETIIEAM